MNRYVLYYDPDQTAVEQAEEYLTEQGIATLESAWNPEDQVYELSTLEEEFEQAKSLLLRFLNRQLAESGDDTESTEESGPFSDPETKQERLKELKELLEIQSGQHAYVNKHTQFEDNFSSALILLTFGVLGVIFIVFEMCGIDPEEYTGFAFSVGLERITLLKYEIDDMRLLYENDTRFLKQF